MGKKKGHVGGKKKLLDPEKKKKRLDPEKIRKLYVVKGWSMNRIALHVGVSTQTISTVLKRLGVPARPRTVLSDETTKAAVTDEIKKLYLEEGWTQIQIASLFGVSKWSIANELKKLGLLPPRPLSILQDPKKRPAVIKKIKDLYANQEISLSEIARRVNVAASSVAELLRKEGLNVPKRPPRRPNPEKVVKLYCEKHWSQRRIAEHLGVSHKSVRTALKQMGVPSRPRTVLKDYEKGPALVEKIKDLYVNQRLSVEEVARRVHVIRQTVSKLLKSEGIAVPRGQGPKPALPRDLKEILHLYQNEGWTVARIAARLGFSTPTIRNDIKTAGGTLRGKTPALDPAKIRELYVDQEVSVVKIANQFGVGYRTITKILNAEGIEVPRGRRRSLKKRRSSLSDPRLAKLEVGESFQIQVLDPSTAHEYFLRLAKGMKIGISIQKVGPTALLITRYE